MIPGRKELSSSLPSSAFAPLHHLPPSSFIFQPTPTYQPTQIQTTTTTTISLPDKQRTLSYTPSESSSPTTTNTTTQNATITQCTIIGCSVCEAEGPVATEFSSTSWTAILKLVLSVLHYHHSKQDYFANNIITHFVKTHWDKISGSKKWNADWKSRISDCLSHNSKCFDSSERGKWRLKDRQHVEETITRMKEKDREWRRSTNTNITNNTTTMRDTTQLSVTMPFSSLSPSSASSSPSLSPTSSSSQLSPPLVSPLNLLSSSEYDEIYAMDATYTSPRSPKKQRLSSEATMMTGTILTSSGTITTSSSSSSTSGLSPRIGSLSLSAPGYPHEVTRLSPRANSPKGSPRSNPISPRPISPRGVVCSTSSPRLPHSLNSSPRSSLLHYAHHNTSCPVFPFSPSPSSQIPAPSLSSSGGVMAPSSSSVVQSSDVLSTLTLPPLDHMDVIKEEAPTITITQTIQTIQQPIRMTDHHQHQHQQDLSSQGRVPLLNLTGEEQMASARWTDYRTSQDRITVDRFLTVVPTG